MSTLLCCLPTYTQSMCSSLGNCYVINWSISLFPLKLFQNQSCICVTATSWSITLIFQSTSLWSQMWIFLCNFDLYSAHLYCVGGKKDSCYFIFSQTINQTMQKATSAAPLTSMGWTIDVLPHHMIPWSLLVPLPWTIGHIKLKTTQLLKLIYLTKQLIQLTRVYGCVFDQSTCHCQFRFSIWIR